MSRYEATAPRIPAERLAAAVTPASFGAFALYAIAIPLMAAVGLDGAPSAWVQAGVILLMLAVYSGARISYELGRGASRSFVLIFHSFTYVFLGVVPVVQIGARTLLWAAVPAADVLTEAAVVCLAGVLAFDLGFSTIWTSLGARRAATPYQAPPNPSEPTAALGFQHSLAQNANVTPSADRALRFLLVLSLLSIVLLSVRGGLGLVFASQSEMTAVLCSGISTGDLAECGVVTALVRIPPLILLLVAVGLRNRGSRSVVRLAIIVGIVGLLVTANPISTSRFWFGAAMIGVLGVLAAGSSRSRVLIWLALPAALILVFPSLDFGRYRDWTADVSIQTNAVVAKQDFDAFQQVSNGIAFVDVSGPRDGTQITSAMLFFVPRSIWGDKAPATGPLVNASLGVTDNINVSAPLWEEAYVDFGLGGVVVLLGLLGSLMAFVEFAVQSSLARGGGLIATVAPFFAAYGMFVLRGSLLPAIGPLTFAVLLVVVVKCLGIDRPPRVSSERTHSPALTRASGPKPARRPVGAGPSLADQAAATGGGAGRDVA